MPKWVQDPVTLELIPKEEYAAKENDSPYVHGDIESFVSPITREIISDRAQLRRHNKKHGVTDSRDYSEDFKRKASIARNDAMTGNTPQAKAERIELLNETLRKQGI